MQTHVPRDDDGGLRDAARSTQIENTAACTCTIAGRSARANACE